MKYSAIGGTKYSAINGISYWVQTTGLCLGAATLLASAAATLVGTTSANAKPEFAAQTGKACVACHQNPSGGGKLKPLGEKFKANGNKLPK
ncbi:MAG: hypothetical protein WBZ28_25790 [Pseudolabrys sp.]